MLTSEQLCATLASQQANQLICRFIVLTYWRAKHEIKQRNLNSYNLLNIKEKMSSLFMPRTLVNGNMLPKFKQENVSIMLRVEEGTGRNFKMRSTDNQRINVILPEPLDAREGSWVEIIGQPIENDKIRAKEAILFAEENVDFDEEGYNMMVQFINNCQDIFRHG